MGEPGDEEDVAERAGRPGLHLDLVPDPHAAELGEPRPVGVPGEPGVRVPVQVDLQVPAALVQRRGRHQPLLAGGGVLRDEERGLLQLLQEPLAPGRVRLVQGPHDAFEVRGVLSRVEGRHGQRAVPAGPLSSPAGAYRGRMISSTSVTMSGSVNFSASRNARATGASATARRTVGKPVPAGPGS